MCLTSSSVHLLFQAECSALISCVKKELQGVHSSAKEKKCLKVGIFKGLKWMDYKKQ